MANVKNNYSSPLVIGGIEIQPKRTAKVDKFQIEKSKPVIQTWLKLGIIEEQESAVDDKPLTVTRPELRALRDGANNDITQKQDALNAAYAVEDKGRGWFVVTQDGQEATKSFRGSALEGFENLSQEEKADFVEANQPEV